MTNLARKTSYDSLSQKNQSARTVLQKSLKSTERAAVRRRRRDRPSEKPKILDLSEGRLKYRFIKDPKMRNSKSINLNRQSNNTLNDKSLKTK